MNDVTVTWEASGRPRLLDPAAPRSELSLSHDGDLGLAVVGTGPQGCDLQAVAPRSRGDWEALLGRGRTALLDALIARGDTLDQAGTRVWAVVEAAIKALGAPVPQQITVLRQEGGGILLEAGHAVHGPWQVFTSLVSLEPGRDHVVAMGLPTEPRALLALVPEQAAAGRSCAAAPTPTAAEPAPRVKLKAVPMPEPVPAPASAPARDSASAAAPGRPALRSLPAPSGAGHVQTFPVLVRDVPKAVGTVHFPSYVSWMGASREDAMRGVMAQVEDDVNNGVGKFVSTTLSLACLAPATVGDRLSVACSAWADDWAKGPYTFGWDFRRGGQDGPLVARGTMQAVWIHPVAPGKYGVGAPPAYLREEAYRLSAPAPIADPAARLELLGALSASGGPAAGFAEADCEIPIWLDDTDFQGHANFANYFRWQGVARDELLHAVGIDVAGGPGAPTCLSSETKYLREVLPFEKLRASAKVTAVYEYGLDLRFSFERPARDGRPAEKVALGRQLLALTRRGRGGEQTPVPLPATVLEACGLARTLTGAKAA
jgi:enediyne polyketide synthase